MASAPDMREVYKEFHRQMDKAGFRPLIRSASKIFDAPVVFTDSRYQLVSLYPARKINDFVYDTLLETGGLSDETIAAFHSAYLHQPGKTYEPFFEADGLVKDCPRIFAEVYDGGKVFGHLAIFLKDIDFAPWQLEVAALLTEILRIKINLSNQMPAVLSDTLQYLLDRDTTRQAKSRVIEQLSDFKMHNAILLVAPLDQTKAQHAFASVAINYFLHKYPNSIPTLFQDDLVVLLTSDGMTDLHAMAEKISDYLQQYHILSGATDMISDIFTLPDAYLQARLSARYRMRMEAGAEAPPKLSYYQDLAPRPLFLHLSERPEFLGFIHPALDKIKAFDELNNTAYYETLASYCRNLFQKNETSEELHLHRNTLNYRLARMEELFDLDLRDYQTLLHLVMSIEMSAFKQT